MRMCLRVAILLAVSGFPAVGRADDVATVKKAVERSTLNQPGTKPFHLKAVLAPSLERDEGAGLTGEVEIWWASPMQYRREVRSPQFHQIDIVNGGREWQKNEGDYFPEWLRETAVALIDPVPDLDSVLEHVKEADVKALAGTAHFSWMETSTDGKIETNMGAGIDVSQSAGLLTFGGGFGWGGAFENYEKFHDRMVARTVAVGTPEVTAKVTTLEDLQDVPPGFFDASASGGDAPLLQTVKVEEIALRKNLLPAEPILWPPLQDGPLEGGITTEIVVDRNGKVREVGSIVINNNAMSDAAKKVITAMQFQPYLQNGVPVQVLSRISLAYKTTRPEGVETLESARTYFERGRQAGFPAAGKGPAYVLQATFQAKVRSGTVETGQYVDTWQSDDKWRREATIGKSRFVRARDGEKRYQLAEGTDAALLRLVLTVVEPIPAIDTFWEGDWKIKRDMVDGVGTIRVLMGYEGPNGTLDPEHSRGYWFDESGRLLKTYGAGLETQRSDFQSFGDVQVAHEIRVLHDGALGMLIRVTQVTPAGVMPENTFKLSGHEWTRAFTDEVR
jgi:hypothetical protein